MKSYNKIKLREQLNCRQKERSEVLQMNFTSYYYIIYLVTETVHLATLVGS